MVHQSAPTQGEDVSIVRISVGVLLVGMAALVLYGMLFVPSIPPEPGPPQMAVPENVATTP
jgi:hypothetical protein